MRLCDPAVGSGHFLVSALKDWNIQINYGIKTGFNDAFIISTEKRDEILANCQTEDERVRTAELHALLLHEIAGIVPPV